MKLKHQTLKVVLAVFVAAACLQPFVGLGQQNQPEQPTINQQATLLSGELLPTGKSITPNAAKGSEFFPLNPDLPNRPDFTVGQAVTTATSPDGNTLLVLTSGYNRNNNNVTGARIAAESNEYVFIYDISTGQPVKRQVVQIPNTFNGLAWNPNGREFYVSGGVNDNVRVFSNESGTWVGAASPIPLGHNNMGVGPGVGPMVAGLAVTASGNRLLAANFSNDSVSVINLETRAEVAELDLRPGKIDPSQAGVAGGEYPFWIAIKGDNKAYVSSQRDREIVVLDISSAPSVIGRIKTTGQPNKMILNKAQDRLYAALDNSDSVAVIDTATDSILEEFTTTAPAAMLLNPRGYRGSSPNSLALSPSEGTLFVTNGGTNSVAVIRLGEAVGRSQVVGLIPTGWYPNSVSVSKDGSQLFVVNGKSNAGPNPGACRNTTSIAAGSLGPCSATNQYVWQLTKAGFLTLPVPTALNLLGLTRQVAQNNNFLSRGESLRNEVTMAALRQRIKHVIYVIKENRTYDQVLGDLEKGNGDPSLAILPEPISPNHHQLARQFVTLDNFYDSGEVSGDGWGWSTAARTTDFSEKTVPVQYAGRGLTYDWEGANRNINVGLATTEERRAQNPANPNDPDLLPGTADVAAPDSSEGEAGAGYLWDGALRANLTVRNYGIFVGNRPPLSRRPFDENLPQAAPLKAALMDKTDIFFRGYDQNNADFWLFKEWEREFDQYVAGGNLPNLSLVRLPHDHFGNFATAIDGVNTVETQMADNDYAVGLLVEKVADSPYKDSTLIFVIEDDAQNGPDHVDAHRSIAYVVGPYVKQGPVVSEHYTTVSMIRTIEDVLGIEPLNLNDGLTEPMTDVFDLRQRRWTYNAIVPEVLRTTQLPLPAATAKNSLPLSKQMMAYGKPRRTSAYWAEKMAGLDFNVEDNLDEPRFNRALWAGLMGEDVPYPTTRHNRNLARNRGRLLEKWRRAKLVAMR